MLGAVVGALVVSLMVMAFLTWYSRPTDTWIVANESDDVRLNFVSGTEYVAEQDGQVIVELRAVNGSSLTATGNCTAYIWYPNKTAFVTNQLMTVDNSTGNAYITFTAPATEGIYEYQARCTAKGKDVVASKSFHVTAAGLKAWTTT
jgi:hypothetical protein